jgi:alanine racemase
MLTEDPVDRWAWAVVDLDAVSHNVSELCSTVAPSAVWAVVKANAYGHGAVEVARAAVRGGATGLCVALADEGVQLRRHGVEAPILVLSEQPVAAVPPLVAAGLIPTVYTADHIEALDHAARSAGNDRHPVHLKVDTGMQRVGAAPHDVVELVERITRRGSSLQLAGIYTHLAVADDPTDPFTAVQLQRFDAVLAQLGDAAPSVVHAANSAAALAIPGARRSLVRAGIAVYGISPGHGVDDRCTALRPALSLRARVSLVKRVEAGTGISYGLRHRFERDTIVATVPIGYADGVPRRLSSVGGSVLIGGRRCPIVGVVTMDQLMVDCGPDSRVARGDEVVLIGEQDGPHGLQRIRAEDWADALDTIGYEIVCGIGPRVPRRTARSIGSDR